MPTIPFHDITLPMQPSPRTRGTLLSVAKDLDAALFAAGAADRTGLGATWLPWGEIAFEGDDSTCETEYDKDEARDLPEIATQPAFKFWDSLICSTLGTSLDMLASRLDTNITEFISAFITRELVTAALSGGVGLIGNATYTPLKVSNTATSLPVALGNLQALLNTVQPGARFTFHLTPGLYDQALALGLAREVGDHAETHTGHILVGDAGQLGTDTPHGATSATANTESWIYGSGDIYYRTTPVKGVTEVDQGDGGAVKVLTNKNKPLVERTGLILFDPNVLAAAKVSVAWP